VIQIFWGFRSNLVQPYLQLWLLAQSVFVRVGGGFAHCGGGSSHVRRWAGRGCARIYHHYKLLIYRSTWRRSSWGDLSRSQKGRSWFLLFFYRFSFIEWASSGNYFYRTVFDFTRRRARLDLCYIFLATGTLNFLITLLSMRGLKE